MMKFAKSILVGAVALIGCSAASATTVSSLLNVDNTFSLYVSTNDSVAGTLVGSGTNWPTTYSFTQALSSNVTNYLHVVATNQGGPGGFEGMFTLSDTAFRFANGTQQLLTNTTDWSLSRTGFGVGYVTPVDEGANGVGPWNTASAYGSNSPHWLWSYNSVNSGDFNTVYFSAAILAADVRGNVPEPASLALLGLALVGLVASRRRKTA